MSNYIIPYLIRRINSETNADTKSVLQSELETFLNVDNVKEYYSDIDSDNVTDVITRVYNTRVSNDNVYKSEIRYFKSIIDKSFDESDPDDPQKHIYDVFHALFGSTFASNYYDALRDYLISKSPSRIRDEYLGLFEDFYSKPNFSNEFNLKYGEYADNG